MMRSFSICLSLFAFIILLPFFDSVNTLNSILFYKRTFNQDGITNIVSDEQQKQNPNNPPKQVKKRRKGVKKPLTEEQKDINRQRVREYKLLQSRKGLKEAKKYMTSEAYAKLEKSANRRRHMEKIYRRRYRERKEEERKSSITPLKLGLTPQQSEKQKSDIERANRAALFQLSSSPPFKKKIHKHKDTQTQHQNRMQEGPSQP